LFKLDSSIWEYVRHGSRPYDVGARNFRRHIVWANPEQGTWPDGRARELFVLLLMTILPQSLLTLVGSNLMPFPFLTAGHAS